MNALTASHDAAVQMIDTPIVRVHQHGACIAGNSEQVMGRLSRPQFGRAVLQQDQAMSVGRDAL
jgi:hypothetical protein